MKKCSDCGLEKSKEEFATRSAKCRPCHNLYNKNHYQNNKQYYIDKASKNRKKNYELHGLTEKQYNLMLQEQEGLCKICKKVPPYVVDHDHKCCNKEKSCGKCVRGLLCGLCNHLLGHAKDDVNTLKNAVDYLNGSVV